MEGKYQMNVVYERGAVQAIMLPDHHVSWLSFMIEQAFQWFLGKGIWRMTIVRRRLDDGRIELRMESDGVTPKPLSFAAIAELGTLLRQGFIPAGLEASYELAPESSVVSSEELKLSLSLAFLGYGFSDMLAAFFLRGVENARYQISAWCAQLWIDIGMEPHELAAFMAKDRDYGPETTLDALPWRR